MGTDIMYSEEIISITPLKYRLCVLVVISSERLYLIHRGGTRGHWIGADYSLTDLTHIELCGKFTLILTFYFEHNLYYEHMESFHPTSLIEIISRYGHKVPINYSRE